MIPLLSDPFWVILTHCPMLPWPPPHTIALSSSDLDHLVRFGGWTINQPGNRRVRSPYGTTLDPSKITA